MSQDRTAAPRPPKAPSARARAGRLVAPAAVLAATAFLLAPAETRAFDVFGDMLDLTQRDFRILSNFTGPFANTNQIPDPDFPGSLGADLAIRKAVAEWGSRPHGSGLTDPLQHDELGSGRSNFDAFFSGAALVQGGRNGNIVSVLPQSGGAFAITDLPIGDGWRIRFFEGTRSWNDNPFGILMGGNAADIQGVMTHEYGHALGLAHSQVVGATMRNAVVNRGLDLRTIEQDDRDGVQFLYGVLDPSKPVIEDYELLPGGIVRLLGTGFDPTDNEVWFTPADPLVPGDGTPIQAFGVPAVPGSGGTELEVPVPAGATDGSVAVVVPGGTDVSLSNVFPLDLTREPWTPPVLYGTPGTSSTGDSVELEWRGIPSLTAGGVRLRITGGPQSGFGLIVSGTTRAQVPTGYGTLLVGGQLRRAAVVPIFFGAGEVDAPFDAAVFVGARRMFQGWMPDPGAAGGVFTNAVEVEVVP
ncbi:MAG: matrixin family metalloprotease [Planctomycetota bacterium]